MIYEIDHIVESLRNKVKTNKLPQLDIVKTSHDFASEKYISNKIKTGTELGYRVNVITPEEMGTSEADGIIVQLPVGDGYNEKELLAKIPVEKDVDGFNPVHLGNIMRTGSADLEPCTARGIVQIIESFFYGNLAGKRVTIVNRSNIVGKPLAMMLINRDCTVTVCHSKTEPDDLQRALQNADVVITAVGQKDFIHNWMLKMDCLVVDVAINRDENGKMCGDVAEDVKASPHHWTTPVPGGVGRLTVLNLLYNTLKAKVYEQP